MVFIYVRKIVDLLFEMVLVLLACWYYLGSPIHQCGHLLLHWSLLSQAGVEERAEILIFDKGTSAFLEGVSICLLSKSRDGSYAVCLNRLLHHLQEMNRRNIQRCSISDLYLFRLDVLDAHRRQFVMLVSPLVAVLLVEIHQIFVRVPILFLMLAIRLLLRASSSLLLDGCYLLVELEIVANVCYLIRKVCIQSS